MYRMKVTANISDEIVSEVKRLSNKGTITEAITLALTEWIDLNQIKELNAQVDRNPLEFLDSFNGEAVRDGNRNR